MCPFPCPSLLFNPTTHSNPHSALFRKQVKSATIKAVDPYRWNPNVNGGAGTYASASLAVILSGETEINSYKSLKYLDLLIPFRVIFIH
jgi:hypothetical protein